MQPLPHRYDVTVTAIENNRNEITSRGLTPFTSAPPREFDGPGNLWSPEALLVGAAADCFVLTFRAIAGLYKVKWNSLVCDAQGTVDRSDGVMRFTAIRIRAHLTVPTGADATLAHKVFEKAEKSCVIANSLKCVPALETKVMIEETVLASSQ
jgi:peroxiredoxin-like protein